MLLPILIVIFIFLIMTNGNKKEEDPCKNGHKWVYKKQPDQPEIEYLVCDRCGRFPGGDLNEEQY